MPSPYSARCWGHARNWTQALAPTIVVQLRAPGAGSQPAKALESTHWIRSALEQYEEPLVGFATRLLGGDVESARDVVQDTFLRLCDQDQAEIEQRLKPWLYTVCRNRAMDVMKKERRMTPLEISTTDSQPAPELDPALSAESGESRTKVLDFLDDLPADQRDVIRLKFQESFSYGQIAEITGHSVGNVGYLLHVGLKRLRERIAPLSTKEATS